MHRRSCEAWTLCCPGLAERRLVRVWLIAGVKLSSPDLENHRHRGRFRHQPRHVLEVTDQVQSTPLPRPSITAADRCRIAATGGRRVMVEDCTDRLPTNCIDTGTAHWLPETANHGSSHRPAALPARA